MKRGLTLVEMLIVIAILSLLFALLFPAINPLRENTKFSQRIQLSGQLLYDKRSRALSGLITHPQDVNGTAVIDAQGVRYSTDKNIGIRGITATLKGQKLFTKNTYEIQEINSTEEYNYLGDDTFFSGSGDTTPLAKIESISLFFKGTALPQATTLDIIYLPLSNDVIIQSDGETTPIDQIEIQVTSLRLSTLSKKLTITPQTANTIITDA